MSAFQDLPYDIHHIIATKVIKYNHRIDIASFAVTNRFFLSLFFDLAKRAHRIEILRMLAKQGFVDVLVSFLQKMQDKFRSIEISCVVHLQDPEKYCEKHGLFISTWNWTEEFARQGMLKQLIYYNSKRAEGKFEVIITSSLAFTAAEHNQLHILSWLEKEKDLDHSRILIIALKNQHIKILNWCWQKKKPNIRWEHFRAAIMGANDYEDNRCLEWLQSRAPGFLISYISNSYQLAIKLSSIRVLEWLYKNHPEGVSYRSVLFIARIYQRTHVIEWLNAKGVIVAKSLDD
jgi:hypothetical protein